MRIGPPVPAGLPACLVGRSCGQVPSGITLWTLDAVRNVAFARLQDGVFPRVRAVAARRGGSGKAPHGVRSSSSQDSRSVRAPPPGDAGCWRHDGVVVTVRKPWSVLRCLSGKGGVQCPPRGSPETRAAGLAWPADGAMLLSREKCRISP
jgi:hypothetical protein